MESVDPEGSVNVEDLVQALENTRPSNEVAPIKRGASLPPTHVVKRQPTNHRGFLGVHHDGESDISSVSEHPRTTAKTQPGSKKPVVTIKKIASPPPPPHNSGFVLLSSFHLKHHRLYCSVGKIGR